MTKQLPTYNIISRLSWKTWHRVLCLERRRNKLMCEYYKLIDSTHVAESVDKIRQDIKWLDLYILLAKYEKSNIQHIINSYLNGCYNYLCVDMKLYDIQYRIKHILYILQSDYKKTQDLVQFIQTHWEYQELIKQVENIEKVKKYFNK
jgi:hypothetical protein